MKRRIVLMSVVAMMVLVSASSAVAEGSGSGTATYMIVYDDTTTMSDGSALRRTHQKGIVLADGEGVPFANSIQDCLGVNILDVDGNVTQQAGYCDGVDPDGDVWVIWFRDNDWGFFSGTGKYDEIEGGGTTTPVLLTPDGRLTITWEGSWK